MRFWIAILCLVLVASLCQGQAKSSASQGTNPDLDMAPIEATVSMPPQSFKANGEWNLTYELRISSFADTGDVTITKLEAVGADGKPLFAVHGDILKSMVDPTAAVGLTLKPRTFTTLFIWITATTQAEIPPAFRHRITIRSSDDPKEMTTETPAITVDMRPVLVIDPPLRGARWVAANGPSAASLHRRALLPIEGRAYIGQRYAIDWAQTYPDGNWFRGDEKVNRDYRGYGQPIYAVADGVVTEARDGIPENVPDMQKRAVEMTLQTIPGNHVIEQIGQGAFATYAHMQTGSVKVKVGDQVHHGQVLGLLGNSGNSTAPHLHFQICDRNSVLGCEGIPYALSSFEQEKDGKTEKREKELPVQDEVVDFGSEPQKP